MKLSDNPPMPPGAGQSSVRRLASSDRAYPTKLHAVLGDEAPSTISFLGNLDVLQQPTLALFCSVRCPGRLILETYDLAQALREAGIAVIGGFHAPMERECLALLLRGKQPVVICPARSIAKLRLPLEWRPALDDGRLLVLSPFDERERRATAELALRRNRFVAALADEVFVAYAAPGSRTEVFARELVSWGKHLLTLDGPENAGLMALGAKVVGPSDFRERAVPATPPDTGAPGAPRLPLFE